MIHVQIMVFEKLSAQRDDTPSMTLENEAVISGIELCRKSNQYPKLPPESSQPGALSLNSLVVAQHTLTANFR